MREFVYQALPARVVFGDNSVAKLAEEAERLDAQRVLVLSTPEQRQQAQDIASVLGSRVVGVHDQAVMHVPMETAQAGRQEARNLNADSLLAVGGGSTIGLAKAIAMEQKLPIIAVPTTFAGSEMTPIWGLTDNGMKQTGQDMNVLPKTVIYDPQLVKTLPPKMAGTSGMNAIAHCVEALYTKDANPVVSLMAEEGIRALGDALPRIAKDPDDLDARAEGQYGAWLAGVCLGSVGMALHHKLCHTLGGSFNLPHAEVHTVVIPYATAYNQEAAADAMKAVERALGCGNAAAGLYDLSVAIGAPTSLKEIGMQDQDLDRAADLATQKPYYNPREVTRDGVRELLEQAQHGVRPGK